MERIAGTIAPSATDSNNNNTSSTSSNNKNQKVHRTSTSGHIFLVRESPLTRVRNTSGGQVLYSCLLSLVALLFLMESTRYIFDRQVLGEDMAFLWRMFERLDVAILTSVCMHIPILLVLYPAVRLLGHSTRGNDLFLWTAAGLSIALISCIPVLMASLFDLNLVLRFSMGIEHVRLLLKVIAYTIEIQRAKETCDMTAETDTDSDKNKANLYLENPNLYSLKSLSYFLFAPTLIYRPTDSYPGLGRPRSPSVLAKHTADLLLLAYVGFHVYRRGYEPVLWELGSVPYSHLPVHYVLSFVLWSTILGWFCLLGIGIGFLHSWLNVWAEALDFGDRQFYKAWWECHGIDEFMRTWNFLIHSWISGYFYRPIRRVTGSKQTALLSVILSSALVHDYIMSLSFNFLSPVFYAIVVLVVVPTFVFALPANSIMQTMGGNFFTFFVLHMTAFTMGFMGSDFATRAVLCHTPTKSRFSMIPGFFDCKW